MWSPKTLPVYQLKIRATIFSKQTDFSTPFACGGFAAKLWFIKYHKYHHIKNRRQPMTAALKSI
ncbi:hypothetical protein, partial [Ruminococcus sp.]|uniref:hypothetical protein n=1 Tax=Ruminococcus sp. TaxID=41978 RepID=UPI003F101B36